MRRLRTAHLKVGDIDSQPMVVPMVAGKRGKVGDWPLSPALPESLREYGRWREPKLYPFPTRNVEFNPDCPSESCPSPSRLATTGKLNGWGD
jgi:hypothetical protein